MRQHNLIAHELSKLNPHWLDERLFQETRKIIGAMLQKITKYDFLPIVIGEDLITGYLLKNPPTYDPHIDPTLPNEFATAAFRFGHSLVQNVLDIRRNTSHVEHEELVSLFFQPFDAYSSGNLDGYVRGLCSQAQQSSDRHFSHMLTNRLFEEPAGKQGAGEDLAARNIQRGRDHGLAPYVDYLAVCGMPRPTSWAELRDLGIMEPETVALFQSVYKLVELFLRNNFETVSSDVNDIDLFPAGLAERKFYYSVAVIPKLFLPGHLPNALVGPTFGCIIGHTFNHLVRGDRFWYENDISLPSAFSEGENFTSQNSHA